MTDLLNKLLLGFWWSRGFLSALALLKIVSEAMGRSITDVAGSVRLILIGWDRSVEVALAYIAIPLPFAITPLRANVFMLLAATLVPAVVLHDLESMRPSRGVLWLIDRIVILGILPACYFIMTGLMLVTILEDGRDQAIILLILTAFVLFLVLQCAMRVRGYMSGVVSLLGVIVALELLRLTPLLGGYLDWLEARILAVDVERERVRQP